MELNEWRLPPAVCDKWEALLLRWKPEATRQDEQMEGCCRGR